MNDKLSAYVMTYNEERFLPQCLSLLCSLTDDVVVVDSGSTDNTVKIAESYPAVRVYQRAMPFHFADQRNYAASLCKNDWILTLDADELLHPDFVRILPTLLADDRYQAYSFPRLALIKDENHYIDKPSITPGDLDTQIRLHKKRLQWGHEDDSGLHEALLVNGNYAATHPAHVPSCVRYVHYPVLHYQFLKSDEALSQMSEAFLGHRSSDGITHVTEADWWVSRKHQVYPFLDLSKWICWLSYPPESDGQKLEWLHNRERRVDELVEYVGLRRSDVETLLDQAMKMENGIYGYEPLSPDKNGIGYLLAPIARYINDISCQNRIERILDHVQDCELILVYEGGVGDIALELAWRGVKRIIQTERNEFANRFFKWRLNRFDLLNRIQCRSTEESLKFGTRYKAIIVLDDMNRTTVSDKILDKLGRHADRLALPFAVETNDTPKSAAVASKSASIADDVTRKSNWHTVDGSVRYYRHNFRLKRRRLERGQKRILAPLMHPPWLYNLTMLNHQFEVLPTPAWGSWCEWLRPLRGNTSILPLDLWKYPDERRFGFLNVAPLRFSDWDCAFIQHEFDIPLLTQGDIPLIFMAHSHPSCEEIVQRLKANKKKIAAAVFTSSKKRDSWRWPDGVVLQPAIDTVEFHGYEGTIAQCLVVCNSFLATDNGSALNRLERVTRGVPVFLCDPTLLNPEDCDYEGIKRYYRTRRVYVHMAQDRAAMSLMEAMSTGMPAVVWRGYTDGILDDFRDGVNCFISNDLDYLHKRTLELINDISLCKRIGEAGRETIRKKHDIVPWLSLWEKIIQESVR